MEKSSETPRIQLIHIWHHKTTGLLMCDTTDTSDWFLEIYSRDSRMQMIFH